MTLKEIRYFFTLRKFVLTGLVVCVLLILFPEIQANRISGNETKIRTAMRDFYRAVTAYRDTVPGHQFPGNFDQLLTPAGRPPFLDESWKEQVRHGYELLYQAGGEVSPETFSLLARPKTPKVTGNDIYCLDQSGLVYASGDNGDIPQGDPQGCQGGVVVAG